MARQCCVYGCRVEFLHLIFYLFEQDDDILSASAFVGFTPEDCMVSSLPSVGTVEV